MPRARPREAGKERNPDRGRQVQDETSRDEEEPSDLQDHDADDQSDSEPSDVDMPPPPPRTSHLTQLRQIPFGALAEAQDSIPASSRRKRPGAAKTSTDPSPQLQALRDRLAELREAKERRSRGKDGKAGGRAQARRADDSGDEQGPVASSKHAPMEQTSTRPVSRKRAVLPELSSNPTHARDPRFHASVAGHVDPSVIAKRYSFLASYETAELEQLQGALKKTKDAGDKAELQRAINSRTNKLKSNTAKDKERELVRDYRRSERERVKQGKKPFFMKKGEIKKKVREELEGGLTGKQKQRLAERREKKKGQKEKRAMPGARRRPLAA